MALLPNRKSNLKQDPAGNLIFRLGDLGPGVGARLLYRVRIGANSREGDWKMSRLDPVLSKTASATETGPARAVVRVGGGVFSTRQVIIGRVFDDVNRNGEFDASDKPISGARLYLTNGQSVITDSQGLYNFPAVGDGSQVIALDPVTVPSGYALADGKSLSGKSWTRLLRTPIGGGAMLRQNFILIGNGSSDSSKLAAYRAPRNDSPYSSSVVQPPTSDAAAPVVNSAATAAIPAYRSAVGVYEFASTETLDPVAPGTAVVLSPAPNSVVMDPAMELVARVALNWTVKLEVNGEQVSEQNIGTRRFDNKNQVTTFTFVSVGLKPGPNRVVVTPMSPVGIPGTDLEMIAIARGPVQRLEIVPDKTAIQAGGRDSTLIRIRALDHWGHPANDGQIGIEASLGQLLRLDKVAQPDDGLLTPGSMSPSADLSTDVNNHLGPSQAKGQLVIPTQNGEVAVKLVGPAQPGEARLHVVAGQLESESLVRILAGESTFNHGWAG